MFNSAKGMDPYWFIGVVVDKDDPTNNGRVKVRAFGIHYNNNITPESNKEDNDIEDQDLPWAFVVNGSYGSINAIPKVGDWVFGFFADGRDCQHPFLLGTLYGQNVDTSGFTIEEQDETINSRQPVFNPEGNPTDAGNDQPVDLPPAREGVATGYEQSNLTQAEVEDIIRQEAGRRGIDPSVAIAVARSEGISGYQSNARRPDGSRERSYGPYQLFMDGGLGNEFLRQTGINPETDRSEASIRKQVQFSLDYAAKNGWGPNSTWYGAGKVGISDRQGLTGAKSVDFYK